MRARKTGVKSRGTRHDRGGNGERIKRKPPNVSFRTGEDGEGAAERSEATAAVSDRGGRGRVPANRNPNEPAANPAEIVEETGDTGGAGERNLQRDSGAAEGGEEAGWGRKRSDASRGGRRRRRRCRRRGLGWGMRARAERESVGNSAIYLFFLSLRIRGRKRKGRPGQTAWFANWAALACLDQLRS
jgi:hypothetical protein